MTVAGSVGGATEEDLPSCQHRAYGQGAPKEVKTSSRNVNCPSPGASSHLLLAALGSTLTLRPVVTVYKGILGGAGVGRHESTEGFLEEASK